MRKRAICILFLLAMMLTLPCATAGAYVMYRDAPQVITDGGDQFAILEYYSPYWWQADDGVYFTSAGGQIPLKLFHLKTGEIKPKLVAMDLHGGALDDYCTFFTSHDGLFALTDTGTLLAYRGAEWEKLVDINIDDINQAQIPRFLNAHGGTFSPAHSFVWKGDLLYFLITQTLDETKNSLVTVDTTSGTIDMVPNLDIEAIAAYKEENLLAYHEGGIRVFDLETLKITDTLVEKADKNWRFSNSLNTQVLRPSPYFYEPETDSVVYIDGEQLFRKTEDGESVLIRPLPTLYSSADNYSSEGGNFGYDNLVNNTGIDSMAPFPGERIAYLADALFIVNGKPLNASVETIRIGVHLQDAVAALYHLTRPQVRIESYYFGVQASDPRKEMPEEYPLDVYHMSTEDGYQYLYKNGYMQPLSDSAIISEAFDTYYPFIKETLTYKGKPMAVPVSLEINPWQYNREAWEALRLPDLPDTLAGFFDLVDVWNRDYAAQHPDISLVETSRNAGLSNPLLSMVDQYIFTHATEEEPVQFDTSEFRALLTAFIGKEYMSAEFNAYTDHELLRCGYGGGPLYSRLSALGKDDYTPILPAVVDEGDTPYVGAIVYFLFAGKDAPTPALALDYLELAAQNASTEALAALSPRGANPVPYNDLETVRRSAENHAAYLAESLEEGSPYYTEKDVQEQERFIEGLSKNPYSITQDVLDFYQSILPYLTLKIDALGGTNKARDDMQGYYMFDLPKILARDGQGVTDASLDRFINYLQETADTVFAHRH